MYGGGDVMLLDNELAQKQLSVISNTLQKCDVDLQKSVETKIMKSPSNLKACDFIFAMLFGILGSVITTNEEISSFLNEIHQISNTENFEVNDFKTLFAKLLHHSGDYMDAVPVVDDEGNILNKFVDRTAQRVGDEYKTDSFKSLHRIFWGHDIFSINKDNPFYLMFKQKGLLGVLQAVRHLIADTCSVQGLPLPFHSYFDYDKDGKRKNLLLEFCQKYSKEVFGKKQAGANNEVFNHIFSIHMQDVISQGLVFALCKGYFKIRNIDDKIWERQFIIVSYAFNFYGGCIIGTVREQIPYINWPSLVFLTKNVIQLSLDTKREIKKLEEVTQILLSEGIELENAVDESISKVEFHPGLNGFKKELNNERQKAKKLIEFFKEEKR